MAPKMHVQPASNSRAIATLNGLRIHPLAVSQPHPRHHRTFHTSSFSPLASLPRRQLSSTPLAAAPDHSPQPTSSDDTWNILDSPGLTPPRSQLPRTDPLSRLARALHAALAWIFPPLASAELLRRLAVTLCMLGLVRVGHYIPIPGLDLNLILNPNSIASGAHLSLTSVLTGSMELPGNMFMLSITPYMTAHFLFAVLQIVPEVRQQMSQLRDQGRAGREIINHYINIAFIICAITQAVVEASKMVPLAVGAAGWAFKTQAALTLFASAVVCKFAVQTVEQWGLGDGPGIVIGAGIALAYSQTLALVTATFMSTPPHPLALITSIALVFSLVAMVVWVQGIELRLPLTFYTFRRSTAQSSHPVLRMLSRGVDSTAALDAQQLLPLRLSPAGTRQLLFANFWVSTLAAPLEWVGISGNILNNPWAFAALVFVLEAVSIADATPRQAAAFLAQSDAGIRGLSPGLDTERFLALRRRQMKALNAAFIAGVSLVARAVDAVCAGLIGVPLGCLNLLLLVSTVLGGARQVDALTQGPKLERKIAEDYAVLEEVVAGQGRTRRTER